MFWSGLRWHFFYVASTCKSSLLDSIYICNIYNIDIFKCLETQTQFFSHSPFSNFQSPKKPKNKIQNKNWSNRKPKPKNQKIHFENQTDPLETQTQKSKNTL